MRHYLAAPYQGRLGSILRLCPDAFTSKAILCIGANSRRFSFAESMRGGRCTVSVIEAFLPNVLYLRRLPWIRTVVHMDVREVLSMQRSVDGLKCDIVLWWHGPEHVEEAVLPRVLTSLEALANDAVVLGCPWGYCPQGAVGGNLWERHLAHCEAEMLESLGYEVECLGQHNVEGSNITAVKSLRSDARPALRC